MRNKTLLVSLLSLSCAAAEVAVGDVHCPQNDFDARSTCLLNAAESQSPSPGLLSEALSTTRLWARRQAPRAAAEFARQFAGTYSLEDRPDELAELLLLAGNLEAGSFESLAALAAYSDAIRLASNDHTRNSARLNKARLLWKRYGLRTTELPTEDLTPGQHLVRSELALEWGDTTQAGNLLEQHGEAGTVEPNRLGNLGRVAMQEGRVSDAATYFRAAVLGADSEGRAYEWLWRLGRVHVLRGEREEAERLFGAALAALERERSKFWGLSDAAFRETLLPVYHDAAANLLAQSTSKPQLKRVIDILEQARIAAVENYFRDICSVPEAETGSSPGGAAIVYPLPLDDTLHLIVTVGAEVHHVSRSVSAATLNRLADRVRLSVQNRAALDTYAAQQLGEILVGSYREILSRSNIDTLVFVDESALQGIPLGVLSHRGQPLVEQFSLAITPSMKLTRSRIGTERYRALNFGITQAVQGFSALPAVSRELESIERVIPARSRTDDRFNSDSFLEARDRGRANVLHLATHARIAADHTNSYLLAYDRPIYLNDLQQLAGTRSVLGQPYELIVLSACETAVGDRSAALGFGGLAVRAGAKAALASLWQVDDEATSVFVGHFYRALANGSGKAQALREAQSQMIDSEYGHPYFWSGFMLLGDWR